MATITPVHLFSFFPWCSFVLLVFYLLSLISFFFSLLSFSFFFPPRSPALARVASFAVQIHCLTLL